MNNKLDLGFDRCIVSCGREKVWLGDDALESVHRESVFLKFLDLLLILWAVRQTQDVLYIKTESCGPPFAKQLLQIGVGSVVKPEEIPEQMTNRLSGIEFADYMIAAALLIYLDPKLQQLERANRKVNEMIKYILVLD